MPPLDDASLGEVFSIGYDEKPCFFSSPFVKCSAATSGEEDEAEQPNTGRLRTAAAAAFTGLFD
jgi:hypothetical protein